MAGFDKLTDFDKQLIDWMVEKDLGHSRECVLSDVIEQVTQLIITGEIVNYRYDNKTEELVLILG